MERNHSSIIKVIGVGGGGSNAVNHMFRSGITGVDFIVCNTDAQALESSPIPTKLQLGMNLTQGLGAGSFPETGRKSAEETIDEIRTALEGSTKMVFITAGMGGGTGTGAAPVIAGLARDMGLLSVAIVSMPFAFEGRKRKIQAEQGIEELRKKVDTLLVVSNEKLRELHGNLTMSEAFAQADNILTTAAKGIAEIITVPGYINVDFEDIKTVMSNSGVAIMGTGVAEGENRAVKAIEMALQSPLLNDNEIKGANNVLLYISSGQNEIRMDEVDEITSFIQQSTGENADIIWGNSSDPSLGENISVTVIATGFKSKNPEFNVSGARAQQDVKTVVHSLPDLKPAVPRNSNVPAEVNNHPFVDQETGLFDFEVKTVEDFDIPPEEEPMLEVVLPTAKHEPEPELDQETATPEMMNSVEMKQGPAQTGRSDSRVSRLREMSMKLKSPSGLHEVENQPAYMRKNVKLDDTPNSGEPHVSRFTLDGDEDKPKTDLGSNNTYLHDNVD